MFVKYPYTTELQSDGKYLVRFVDFPTGVAEADSLKEAAVFAQEVLEGLIEVYQEDELAIPAASPVGSLAFVEVTL